MDVDAVAAEFDDELISDVMLWTDLNGVDGAGGGNGGGGDFDCGDGVG